MPRNKCNGFTPLVICLILFGPVLTPILCSPIVAVYWLFADADSTIRYRVLLIVGAILAGWIERRRKLKPPQDPK